MKKKLRHIKAFEPVYSKSKSKVLFLGTCPGNKSLDRGFYYMDSGNSFWKLIDYVTGNKNYFNDLKKKYIESNDIDRSNIKKEIISSLHKYGIAIYDVVESCDRLENSSKDCDIVLDTVKCTDIKEICNNVDLIVINGTGKRNNYNTYNLFKKYNDCISDDKIKCVVSSSNARPMSLEKKKDNWKKVLKYN